MIKQSASKGNGMARGPRAAVGAITLVAFFLAQVSGCASVITRIEGGRLTVLTARALGVRPSYVITWGRRLEPDGTLIWHARGCAS